MLYVATPTSPAARCVSCHPDGTPPTTDVQVVFAISGGGESRPGHLSRLITDDGRRVFFTSGEALVPEDVNGKRDAYEYDVASGSLSLLSSGRSSADSYYLETTPSGDDALFLTREQLVGWDRDSNYDLYDARVGGGFPEPAPPPPACTGQDCHPTTTTTTSPPSFAPSASQTSHTAGNLTGHLKPRPKPCHHGQIRTHTRHTTRCVKRKTHTRCCAASQETLSASRSGNCVKMDLFLGRSAEHGPFAVAAP